MYAFSLTVDNAMLFFEICRELKADKEEERMTILQAMAQLGKVQNIVKTKMTRAQYVKHLSKNFKCAIVKSKGDAQQEK